MNQKNGLVNRGNWTPIRKVMKKAKAGEPVTVAFLGGSITQGSLASTKENCYAYLVYEWWKRTFPQAAIHFINAGIGGTTSHFGVARVEQDVLRYEPDFLLTEFSVNDASESHFKETFEGLVRKILSRPNAPALMLAHNYYYLEKWSSEELHLAVGKYYDLPCVSMKSSVQAAIEEGEFTKEDISPDGLHPNDRGHRLIAEVIVALLEEISGTLDAEEEEPVFPVKPLTKNRYENSVRYQNTTEPIECVGFVRDETLQHHITECFRNGYIGRESGSRIVFEIEAACIAIQYRKSVAKPAPIARVTVDGKEENSFVLDGNFDQDWGDCLALDRVYEAEESVMHRVAIEITEGTGEEEIPFYLVSVIGSRR